MNFYDNFNRLDKFLLIKISIELLFPDNELYYLMLKKHNSFDGSRNA